MVWQAASFPWDLIKCWLASATALCVHVHVHISLHWVHDSVCLHNFVYVPGSMCVCMLSLYMGRHVLVCKCAYFSMCIQAFVCEFTCLWLYIVYVYMCICMCLSLCGYVCKLEWHVYVQLRVCTNIYVHSICVYTHELMCAWVLVSSTWARGPWSFLGFSYPNNFYEISMGWECFLGV